MVYMLMGLFLDLYRPARDHQMYNLLRLEIRNIERDFTMAAKACSEVAITSELTMAGQDNAREQF